MEKKYIDYDAACEVLKAHMSEGLLVYLCCNILDQIPAADVAPVVHGEWIDKGEFFPPCHCYECSVCKKLERMAEHKQSLFCPNCGAKMDADTISDNADRCVCCGDVIPEGRQVCPACEGGEPT